MRKLEAAKLAHEYPGLTFQATAVVHEACLRVVGHDRVGGWNGRGHFFGAATEAMRRILVEKARLRTRIRHGGARQRVDFQHIEPAAPCEEERLLALNEALDQLEDGAPMIAWLDSS